MQTDNFEIPQGKLVATQVLSSGEWKFRVKPELLINKHEVGMRSTDKSKHCILQTWKYSTESEEEKEVVTLSGRHNLEQT